MAFIHSCADMMYCNLEQLTAKSASALGLLVSAFPGIKTSTTLN
jgi:hypothetical protein